MNLEVKSAGELNYPEKVAGEITNACPLSSRSPLNLPTEPS